MMEVVEKYKRMVLDVART